MSERSRKCYVFGCTTVGGRFHRFSSNKERAEKWRKFCQNPKLECYHWQDLHSNFQICAKHFAVDAYTYPSSGKLLRSALPKLHPPKIGKAEVTAEDSAGPVGGTTSESLNEVIPLTPKVEPDDESVECTQDEIPMETYESLQCEDVRQPNSPRVIGQGKQDRNHIIEELPEYYSLITLPYLEQNNLNLQEMWVYRILSGEEGSERKVYESPNKDDKDGFMLIRDSGWDGVDVDNLHCIAIAYRPGIMSLRELGRKHLKLLQNINSVGKEVIMKKYDVVASELRVYLQYIPTFFHLHVHFTAINDSICGPHYGTAHPLSSVIHNIQLSPTFYQDAPLNISLKESDELFLQFEAQGVVRRSRHSSGC